MTTRAQSLGGLAHAVQIRELSVPAGALLLLRRSGMLPLSASLQDAREEDLLLASQLVHEMGGLPLAIDQAAEDLELAAAAASEAHELANRSGDVRDTIRASWLQGRVLTRLAERERSRMHLDEAARSLDAALGMCRQEKVVDYEADLLLASAHLSLVEGDAARAGRLGREALAIADRAGFRVLEADIRNLLAEVALRAGRRREALAHAQRAIACAECDGAPYCYRPAIDVAQHHLTAATQAAG